jgi:hypothetical protein
LHGEGLRLQTTHRSRKSVEQTHDIISANETRAAAAGLPKRNLGLLIAISVPEILCNKINDLSWNGSPPEASATGAFFRARQFLPIWNF